MKKITYFGYVYSVTKCPNCKANLCDTKQGVTIELTTGSHNWEEHDILLEDGTLRDLEDSVEKGLHSATFCRMCGCELVYYEQQFEFSTDEEYETAREAAKAAIAQWEDDDA